MPKTQAAFTNSLLHSRTAETNIGCELIDTIKLMKWSEFLDKDWLRAYEQTEITGKLHAVFGFRTDYQLIDKKKLSLSTQKA